LLPDGLPVIDRISNFDNAYLATGHGMLGVTLGPVTGKLLADLIATGHPSPKLTPFSFTRL
jgi:D-amino-acid dehydrogenase